jgi:hypothetical protein
VETRNAYNILIIKAFAKQAVKGRNKWQDKVGMAVMKWVLWFGSLWEGSCSVGAP